MTKDETLHFLGGFAKALPWRAASAERRRQRVGEIDRWAFYREWKQNLAGENPNVPLGAHQLREAEAWGEGARLALGVNPQRPYEYLTGQPLVVKP